ncbi:MAG: PEP-CTERM sorting domain-containing protein [Planctomycetota bacterium]
MGTVVLRAIPSLVAFLWIALSVCAGSAGTIDDAALHFRAQEAATARLGDTADVEASQAADAPHSSAPLSGGILSEKSTRPEELEHFSNELWYDSAAAEMAEANRQALEAEAREVRPVPEPSMIFLLLIFIGAICIWRKWMPLA